MNDEDKLAEILSKDLFKHKTFSSSTFEQLPVKYRNADTILLDDVIVLHSLDHTREYRITVGELLLGMIRLKKENPDYFK